MKEVTQKTLANSLMVSGYVKIDHTPTSICIIMSVWDIAKKKKKHILDLNCKAFSVLQAVLFRAYQAALLLKHSLISSQEVFVGLHFLKNHQYIHLYVLLCIHMHFFPIHFCSLTSVQKPEAASFIQSPVDYRPSIIIGIFRSI